MDKVEERIPIRRLLKSSMRDDGGLEHRGSGRESGRK